MRVLKWVVIALVVALLVSMAGFVWWANDAPAPMPEALASLQSDAQVSVQTEPWLTFAPVGQMPTTGLIFYPGGKVDPRAYASLARQIAERGYFVAIVPMPLNLAFFGADRAAQVMRANPTIQHWIIGGHSLGGVAAASFAKNHAAELEGLVLLASYPADSDNLSSSSFPVTSISGTEDKLSTPDKIERSRALLPPQTRFVVIQGGNHGQMGRYGAQLGDGVAAISHEEQEKQIVDAIVALLEENSK